MKIAVVGTGIAGSAAAWALAPRHEVTVFEKEPRPGGHSCTVDVDYDGTRIAVDTGFIVYSEPVYPNLTALLAHLGVATEASDMSFSVTADGGRFEWCGRGNVLHETLDGVFAQRRNLFKPSYLRMMLDVLRFQRVAVPDLDCGALDGRTLGDYFVHRKFSDRFARDYLLPIGAAIWSTPVDQMREFPAGNFVEFFDNHGLLNINGQAWRTVTGGSRSYVEKLVAPFRNRLRLGVGVVSVERTRAGVIVCDSAGHREQFDQIVIAAHSDQALAMLADPSDTERSVLGGIRYRPNEIVLHRDPRLMPKRKRAWGSWNFLRSHGRGVDGGEIAITYWMNRLQNIDDRFPLFLSLNPPFQPAPELTFARFNYSHPQFDTAAFDAQRRLDTMQGTHRTWYCGAWTGYGFHEDGLSSGLAVAQALGGNVPWLKDAPLAEAAE